MRHLPLFLLLVATVAMAGPPSLERALRLEVHGSVASVTDDDIDATYGLLPGGELGVSWAMAPASRLFLSPNPSTGDRSVIGVLPLRVVGWPGNADRPRRVTGLCAVLPSVCGPSV